MLPTGHTVLSVDEPSQKMSFVTCKTAYASKSRNINQEGNGYYWESWGMEGETNKGTN